MARKVKGPDGVVRVFPDDATDEEIGAALEPAAAPTTARLSAGAPGTALPDTADARLEAKWGMKPVLPESARRTMSEPLVHPTGIDVVDSLSSPISLIAEAMTVGGPIAKSAFRSLAGFVSKLEPDVAEHVIGLMSPRVGHGLKLVRAVKDALPAATNAAPAVAEAATPAAAEAVAAPVAGPAPAAAAPFNPSKAMTAAREAFKTAGVEPLQAEASNAMELIRRGKSPDEALATVLRNRPAGAAQEVASVAEKLPKLTASEVKAGMDLIAKGKTPQEAMDAILAQREFLAKFGGLTDPQARAAIDLRNATGKIKTPSAQTAELRRLQ